MRELKKLCGLSNIWLAHISANGISKGYVEVAPGRKSWYVPFIWGTTYLYIAEGTFKLINSKTRR